MDEQLNDADPPERTDPAPFPTEKAATDIHAAELELHPLETPRLMLIDGVMTDTILVKTENYRR